MASIWTLMTLLGERLKHRLEYICSCLHFAQNWFKMDKASWVLFLPPFSPISVSSLLFLRSKFCLTTSLSPLPALKATLLLLWHVSQNYWSLTWSFTFILLLKLILGFLKAPSAAALKVQINRKVLKQVTPLFNFPPPWIVLEIEAPLISVSCT